MFAGEDGGTSRCSLMVIATYPEIACFSSHTLLAVCQSIVEQRTCASSRPDSWIYSWDETDTSCHGLPVETHECVRY